MKAEYDEESDKTAAPPEQSKANDEEPQLELPDDMEMDEENMEEQVDAELDHGSGI